MALLSTCQCCQVLSVLHFRSLEKQRGGIWQRPTAMVKLCSLQRFICTLTWSCADWKPWIWWTMFWRTGRSLWIFLGPFGWMHWIGQDQPKTGLSVCMSWNTCFWICWATWTFYWNTERSVSTSWALCTLMTHICGCFSRPEMDWRCYRAKAECTAEWSGYFSAPAWTSSWILENDRWDRAQLSLGLAMEFHGFKFAFKQEQ